MITRATPGRSLVQNKASLTSLYMCVIRTPFEPFKQSNWCVINFYDMPLRFRPYVLSSKVHLDLQKFRKYAQKIDNEEKNVMRGLFRNNQKLLINLNLLLLF